MMLGLEGLYFPKDAFQFTEETRADKTQQDFTDLFLEAAQRRPTRPRRRRSALPSCGSWSGSSCCAWWTSTGWTTSTPWTTWSLVWLASPPCWAGVRHGFSTRRGGCLRRRGIPLNLGPGRGDAPENVEENYRRFFAALDMDSAYPVLSRQVHRDDVRLCTAADAGKGLIRDRDYDADALITAEKGLPLVVFSADCGILLLHDPDAGCVGSESTPDGGAVPPESWRRPSGRWSACWAPGRNASWPPWGPACCFETDGDVPEAMRASALGPEAEPYLERRGPKYHVDLAGLNRQWLLRAGVAPDHIDVCGLCTACRPDLFWSHRKMGEARGAQVAVIPMEWRMPAVDTTARRSRR